MADTNVTGGDVLATASVTVQADLQPFLQGIKAIGPAMVKEAKAAGKDAAKAITDEIKNLKLTRDVLVKIKIDSKVTASINSLDAALGKVETRLQSLITLQNQYNAAAGATPKPQPSPTPTPQSQGAGQQSTPNPQPQPAPQPSPQPSPNPGPQPNPGGANAGASGGAGSGPTRNPKARGASASYRGFEAQNGYKADIIDSFDTAFDHLPAKSKKSLGETMRGLQSEMAKNKLDFKVADAETDPGKRSALLQRAFRDQDTLKAKMEAVTKAAIDQAKATKAAADAATARKDAATFNAQSAKDQAAQQRKDAADARAAQRASANANKPSGTKSTGGKNFDFGYGLMVGAQFADDLQYGVKAIVGQVPMAVAALGGSAGLAGAIGIVMVAVNQALPKLEDYGRKIGALRNPLRDASGDAKGLAEQLDALKDRPLKLTADYKAIDRLEKLIAEAKAASEHWEQQKGEKSEGQATSQGLVDKTIRDSNISGGNGAQKFEDYLIAAKKQEGSFGRGSEIQGQIAQEVDLYNRAVEKAKGEFAGDNLKNVLKMLDDEQKSILDGLQKKLRDEINDKIGKLVTTAGSDEGARKTLEDYANNPKFAGLRQQFGIKDTVGRDLAFASGTNVETARKNQFGVNPIVENRRDQLVRGQVDRIARGETIDTRKNPELEKEITDLLRAAGKTPEEINVAVRTFTEKLSEEAVKIAADRQGRAGGTLQSAARDSLREIDDRLAEQAKAGLSPSVQPKMEGMRDDLVGDVLDRLGSGGTVGLEDEDLRDAISKKLEPLGVAGNDLATASAVYAREIAKQANDLAAQRGTADNIGPAEAARRLASERTDKRIADTYGPTVTGNNDELVRSQLRRIVGGETLDPTNNAGLQELIKQKLVEANPNTPQKDLEDAARMFAKQITDEVIASAKRQAGEEKSARIEVGAAALLREGDRKAIEDKIAKLGRETELNRNPLSKQLLDATRENRASGRAMLRRPARAKKVLPAKQRQLAQGKRAKATDDAIRAGIRDRQDARDLMGSKRPAGLEDQVGNGATDFKLFKSQGLDFGKMLGLELGNIKAPTLDVGAKEGEKIDGELTKQTGILQTIASSNKVSADALATLARTGVPARVG